MKILILGSAAPGGFPQWNCNCRNCHGARSGAINTRPRTQSSIAVSANEVDWVLVNASPDLLAQLRASPALQPGRYRRDTGMHAVILTDARIDHAAGLLMLRGAVELPLYCTPSVWSDLTEGLPLIHALSQSCDVRWQPLAAHGSDAPARSRQMPGVEHLQFTPIGLNGAVQQAADNIGLLIEDRRSGRRAFYAPVVPHLDSGLARLLREVDCVLIDGTFWTGDELQRLGFSDRSAQEMGHVPQSGAGGMIEFLDAIGERRKILVHVNNTNPILDEDSEERALLARRGIEVAFDGMEVVI